MRHLHRPASTRQAVDALDRIDDAIDRILAAADHLDQPRVNPEETPRHERPKPR